ncbi:MAG: hypothetical protein HYX48_08525 [Chlamydiales bacterium]|nr:hypothetical protein [Chlamydiales bacterium]
MKHKHPGREASNKQHTSRITVKYDVGFKNSLYIRGNGAGLSWTKGKLMKNMGADTWVWETDAEFKECEFKVLVNDQAYEDGENHRLAYGKTTQYTPRFVKAA